MYHWMCTMKGRGRLIVILFICIIYCATQSLRHAVVTKLFGAPRLGKICPIPLIAAYRKVSSTIAAFLAVVTGDQSPAEIGAI